ncbi:hypothetical protein BG004_007855, partial [Podila humilis]
MAEDYTGLIFGIVIGGFVLVGAICGLCFVHQSPKRTPRKPVEDHGFVIYIGSTSHSGTGDGGQHHSSGHDGGWSIGDCGGCGGWGGGDGGGWGGGDGGGGGGGGGGDG